MMCKDSPVEQLKVALMAATDDEIMEICEAVGILYDFIEGKFARHAAVLQILMLPLQDNVDTSGLEALING